MGAKYAVIFLVLGGVCLVGMGVVGDWVGRVVCGSAGVAFVGVGVGYGKVGPTIFLKRGDGRLPLWSYLIFWPYHLLNWVGLGIFRLSGGENAFDEIVPGLYLGSRLTARDGEKLCALGVQSVLDLTSELAEVKVLRTLPGYRCLPLLDTRAPSEEQLEGALGWLRERRAVGPVYVHCALGHGRSATVVAAYLLQTGHVKSVEDAVQHIVAQRPKIGLSASQRRLLDTITRQD